MSYDDGMDYGYTSQGFPAGPWEYLVGSDVECERCEEEGECEICKEKNDRVQRRTEAILAKISSRFKEGTKAVAGLNWNKQVKLTLIHKLHQDGLDSSIKRYMAREALPAYYAAILKNHQCIDRLVQGILSKVCHIRVNPALEVQIRELSSTIRKNPNFQSPYDRVTQIQQFIHRTVDQYLGEGAAFLIPVSPMKNALSVARLHLSIFDVMHHHLVYNAYLDELARAEARLEHVEPRPSKFRQEKRYYARWRVRHLQPLSYFYSPARFAVIEALRNVDESIALNDFVKKSLKIYADYDNG